MPQIVITLPGSPFAFELGEPVVIGTTLELGEVIGRAELERGKPTYHVEYTRADGVMARAWFGERLLFATA